MTDRVPESHGRFHTTRWTLVCSTKSEDPAVAKTALDELCRTYWSPLYAFLRREGHDEHAAMDLVQGFLARLLDKGDVAHADADRGRFRSYLLGALKHYVQNQTRDAGAARRGGDRQVWSLDAAAAEGRYADEAFGTSTPEEAFDRQFALALLDRSIERIEKEYAERGRAGVFARLLPFLTDRAEVGAHAASGADLGLSETAVKVTVHRMRARLRSVLVEELSHTLEDPADAEAELAALLGALGK